MILVILKLSMTNEFWLNCWKNNTIGFHEASPNKQLINHFSSFEQLLDGQRLFLPLCGKTTDIQWLLSKGYHVIGCELSSIAVEALFQSLKFTPTIRTLDPFIEYSGPNINIFCGDIFNLTSQLIGPIDGIYDRAALVALPADIRKKYAHHLIDITHRSSQFLITFTYDQTQMSGPPFSIEMNGLNTLYENNYSFQKITSSPVEPSFISSFHAIEHVFFLKPL